MLHLKIMMRLNYILCPRNFDVELQNHKDDFVGGLIGGNPTTYGKTPDGSSKIKETINIFNGDYTAHSCTGANADKKNCTDPYGIPQSLIIHSNRSNP